MFPLIVLVFVAMVAAPVDSDQSGAPVRSGYYHALIKEFEKHSGPKYWNAEHRRETANGMIHEVMMDHGNEDMMVDADMFAAIARKLGADPDVDGKWYAKEVKKTFMK